MTSAIHSAHSLRTAPLAAVGFALFLAAPASAHHLEKHFTVTGRPVITVQNTGYRGRISVKSWKKAEVVVVGDHTSPKVEVDTEQAGNRIEVATHSLTQDIKPTEMEANYEITVPEESELQIRTDSGMIVVERVYGDLVFDTVAADVQLEEVGGHLLVKTVSGPVTCTRCLGQIEVNSFSGNVQLLQPEMDSVRVQTTSGNILFDGDFLRRGIYVLKNWTGVIEVRFSDTDSFDLTATSLHGVLDNQANLKPDPHGRRFSVPKQAKSLFGTFNEGHAKVDLSSFSGTIRIRKRD
jgi:DUF4097 and DUF4098 domain-containing protein YvlB